jgi:hypothetical protein
MLANSCARSNLFNMSKQHEDNAPDLEVGAEQSSEILELQIANEQLGIIAAEIKILRNTVFSCALLIIAAVVIF